MGFRSDREALRQRVDALEQDVQARDAELAALRTELEHAQTERSAPPARERGKLSIRLFGGEATEPEPSGDRWALPRRKPELTATVFLVLWAGVFSVVGVYAMLEGERGWWVPTLIFVPTPVLMLLYRSGVVIDRRLRTITTYRRLIVRWNRSFDVEGRTLHVERHLVMPKNSDSYWAGDIMLGQQVIAVRKEEEAEALAKRIAEFVGVPFAGLVPRQEQR